MATTNPLEELLKQPREQREAAVEALLDSLEDEDRAAGADGGEFDPSVEEAWLEEIRDRLEDDSPGIPAETVFAELRAKLDKPA